MLILLGPSTKRAHWSVDCDIHGHISTQTTEGYCASAASAHKDATGCAEPVYIVSKLLGGSWRVSDGRDWHLERSTRQLAITAARRHEKEGGANDGCA